MPRVLIFDFNDIGQNYRLLKHTKSFLKLNDCYVYLIGPQQSAFPSEVEDAPNLKYKEMIYTSKFPYLFGILLYPFQILFNILQFIIITSTIKNVDFIMTSSNNNSIFLIFGLIISYFKKSKFILDIYPKKEYSLNKKHNSYYDFLSLILFKLANYKICSTKSLNLYLKLKGIDTFLIRDTPSPLFQDNSNNKQHIYEFLNISNDIPLIGIPFPFLDDEYFQKLLEIFLKSDELLIPLHFIIFSNGKSYQNIENHFKNKKYKNISFTIIPMLTDAYPKILGSCNIGISLLGSNSILDLSQELIEMEWSNLPLIVFLKGCVKEIIKENENGFFYKNIDELINILNYIFIKKEFDLNLLKKNLKKNLITWDENWINIFDQIIFQK